MSDKPWKCPHCKAAFVAKYTLDEHLLHFHYMPAFDTLKKMKTALENLAGAFREILNTEYGHDPAQNVEEYKAAMAILEKYNANNNQT